MASKTPPIIITTDDGTEALRVDPSGNLTLDVGLTASGPISTSANMAATGAMTAGSITATGNIAANGSVTAGTIQGGSITATGNITTGNLNASNITTGNLNAGNMNIGKYDPVIPYPKLTVTGPDATVNVETAEILRVMRYGVEGVKDQNSAGFFVGAFEPGLDGRSRLDINVAGTPGESNTWGSVPDVTVMSLLGNGIVTIPGDLHVNGQKNFVEEHPTDPTQQIVYASLEGGEVGTYTRGTWKLEEGKAVIELPEHFGMVTSEDGLSIQLTARGEWLQLYVVHLTIRQVIVQEAQGKSGQFDYLIQGVRKGYEHHEAIQERKFGNQLQ